MKTNHSKIQIFGTRGSADCYSIRDFLHRGDVPFEYIELTIDEAARTLARAENLSRYQSSDARASAKECTAC